MYPFVERNVFKKQILQEEVLEATKQKEEKRKN
jgi:hypothetical protein